MGVFIQLLPRPLATAPPQLPPQFPDAKGMLRKEWRGVKVPGHAVGGLEFVKTL